MYFMETANSIFRFEAPLLISPYFPAPMFPYPFQLALFFPGRLRVHPHDFDSFLNKLQAHIVFFFPQSHLQIHLALRPILFA